MLVSIQHGDLPKFIARVGPSGNFSRGTLPIRPVRSAARSQCASTSGETDTQARARARAAENEILRRAPELIEALGEQLPRINVRSDESTYHAEGAHTIENHGADIPLRRADNPGGNPSKGESMEILYGPNL